jgi:Trm5-related predicted tRNA methylase
MNYIDYAYYIEFTGSTIGIPKFNELVEIASRIIDAKTMNKATNFTEFPETIQTAIKKATASQLRKLVGDGGINAIDKGNIESESIGSYSYKKTSKSEQKLETINGIEVSPMVDFYLFPTGLLNRKVRGVC